MSSKTIFTLFASSLFFIVLNSSVGCKKKKDKQDFEDDHNIMPFCPTCDYKEEKLCYSSTFNIEEIITQNNWVSQKIKANQANISELRIYLNYISASYNYVFVYHNSNSSIFDCNGTQKCELNDSQESSECLEQNGIVLNQDQFIATKTF